MNLKEEQEKLESLKRNVIAQEQKINEFMCKPDDEKLCSILHIKQIQQWQQKDMCGYLSEERVWLEKAKSILKDFTFEEAVKFINKL